jgi:hypothetical protein
MEAIVIGTVVKSFLIEKTQKIKTAIYTSNRELLPTLISTKKILPEGTKIAMRCQFSIFQADGKAFLIVKEADDQSNINEVKK